LRPAELFFFFLSHALDEHSLNKRAKPLRNRLFSLVFNLKSAISNLTEKAILQASNHISD